MTPQTDPPLSDAFATASFARISAAVPPMPVFVRGPSVLIPELAAGLLGRRTHVTTVFGHIVEVTVQFDCGASLACRPSWVRPALDLPALFFLVQP